ncbi:MAG: UDP-glucose dehydrogenase family protein, partial [Microthrixaceae bacterium]
LRFCTKMSVVADREFLFLCVPTRLGEDGSADLSYVEAAAHELRAHLAPDSIVLNKSTVPVGSTLAVAEALGRDDVHVVSNPEFLREGSAVKDCLNPDRVVIGAHDEAVAIRVATLYTALSVPMILTDAASAELTKYVANAFLATKISFVNAVAAVSEAVGADMGDVVLGVGHDRRIGHGFMNPGPGWGGSCFPKDTRALIRIAADAGYDFDLLAAAVDVNDQQFVRVVRKVEELLDGPLDAARVAVWGLTFKARTDDRRDSPAIEVIQRLVAGGAKVRAYDPAVPEGLSLMDSVEVVGDPYAACDGADVLVVLTEWDDFKRVDLDEVQQRLDRHNVVDARNILDRRALLGRGFAHRGIGR